MQCLLQHAGWFDDAHTVPRLETFNQYKILFGLADESAEIDLSRITRESDAATLPPQCLQIAELGKAEHHFNHVIAIDFVMFGNLVDCCKPFAVEGNEYQGAKTIVRKIGEAHLA